jgi:DNA replication licensing factor MCM5
MFLDMCHDPDIITKVAASIAPKIKGQDDIKMAIACLLFGGSRKVGQQSALNRQGIYL